MLDTQNKTKFYIGMDGLGTTQIIESDVPPHELDWNDGQYKVQSFGNGLTFLKVFGGFNTYQDAQMFDPMEQELETMLVGKDYLELCDKCRAAIDECALSFEDGIDTDDDIEAPCNLVYDLRMFCGSTHCVNKPNTPEYVPTDINEIYSPESVYLKGVTSMSDVEILLRENTQEYQSL